MRKWRIEDSEELYNITGWGTSYFGINDKGHAIFPWQNACYPADRVHNDQVTPWIEAFVNARKWVEEKKK